MNKLCLVALLFIGACAHTPLPEPLVIAKAVASLKKPDLVTKPQKVHLPRAGGILLSWVKLQANELPLHAAMSLVAAQLKPRPGFSYHAEDSQYRLVTISHKGTLKALLSRIETQTGLSVRFEENTLLWRDRVTRVFEIAHLPGQKSFKIGSSNKQSGSGRGKKSGGNEEGATDNAGIRQDDQFSSGEGSGGIWSTLKQSIKAAAGEDASIAIQPLLSTVVITTTPREMRDIARVIERFNEQLSRQVHIEIKVIQVTLDKSHALGIDWSAIRTTSNSAIGVVSQVVSLEQTGLTSYNLQKIAGDYRGSKIVIDALEKQGAVRIITEPTLMALNYQTVEQRLISETGYLASTTAGSGGLTGGQAGLTPGAVIDGMILMIQPNIGKDHILLHTSLTIANLDKMLTIESGGQIIQTPILSKQIFNELTRARDGETLIISGLRQVTSSTQHEQPPGLKWLGGRENKASIIETVLLVTPRIVR